MPRKAKNMLGIGACLLILSSCSTFIFNPGEGDFNAGEEYFKKGDCPEAKKKFTDSLKKNPNLSKAYLYIAECSLREADYKNMLQLLQNALAHTGEKSKERETLKTLLASGGHDALNKNDADNAILFFKEYTALEQENAAPHLWLGNAFLQRGLKGDMKNAVTEFKTAMNRSGDTEKDIKQIREYLMARAKKYSLQGDFYSESRCYLAYTENFNSNDSAAYIALSKTMLKMDNIVGALYYAKKAFALDPNNKELLDLMADLNTPSY